MFTLRLFYEALVISIENKMEDPSNGPAAKLTTLPTSYLFKVKMIKLDKI